MFDVCLFSGSSKLHDALMSLMLGSLCWPGSVHGFFVLLCNPLSLNFTWLSEDKSVNAVFVCTELS